MGFIIDKSFYDNNAKYYDLHKIIGNNINANQKNQQRLVNCSELLYVWERHKLLLMECKLRFEMFGIRFV